MMTMMVRYDLGSGDDEWGMKERLG